MKIGIALKVIGSTLPGRHVWGEEVAALGLAKYIKRMPDVSEVVICDAKTMPDDCDAMIHFHSDLPLKGKTNILWHNALNFRDTPQDEIEMYRANYDALFTSFRRLADADCPFLPMGCDPELFRPMPPDESYACNVCYVGNGIRGPFIVKDYLMPALAFDLHLYGDQWKAHPKLNAVRRSIIQPTAIPILYSSAKIVLSTQVPACFELDAMPNRVSEALACNAFLISPRGWFIEEHLADCVVQTKGEDDLRDKIRYYLDHPRERCERAKKGRELVKRHLSIEIAANRIMGAIL